MIDGGVSFDGTHKYITMQLNMTPQQYLRLLFIATLFIASGGLQWCAPNRSPITHSRLGTSVGASITNTDTTCSEGSVQVFLRFSPLIGGPPIPLHVEVILAEDGADTESKGTIDIRKTNNLESTALSSYPKLHRLDFLPQNPTDPSTVVRLASLQSVPGRLRHRYYAQNITASSDRNQDGRGITVLLPVGSIPYEKDNEEDRSAIISTALEFTKERTDNIYDDLRILLGKNCLSFAIDLLSELNKVHRIQRVESWNKIDLGE